MSVKSHVESKQGAERVSPEASGRHERRHAPRGVHAEPERLPLISLVLGTYAEMPGLALQLHQAARLFGLRERTCRVVFDDLVRDGRLRQCSDSQYRAANGGPG
jgi:hypothetical protein